MNRPIPRRLLAVPAALALGLVLAGCSEDDGRDEVASGGTSASASASVTAGSTSLTTSGTSGSAATTESGGTSGSATDSATSDPSGGSTDPSGTASGTATASTTASTSATTTATTGTRFDVGATDTAVTASAGETSSSQGCKGIDFLFVIDNSGSMGEEQAALVGAFQGFVDAITAKAAETGADSFRIMVVDSDAASFSEIDPGCLFACTILGSEVCPLTGELCVKSNPFCIAACDLNPNNTCCTRADPMMPGVCVGQVVTCASLSGCGTTDCSCQLGGGKTVDQDNDPCGVIGGEPFIQPGQPNLAQTFSCLANVGTSGSGSELVMQAMTSAVGPLAANGQCNDSFLRDDAILVVTYITDEEDGGSAGDPNSWKQTLVAAKGGDESAVVTLGLIGVDDTANPSCTSTSAQPAPRLQQFGSSFQNGLVGSVCGSQQYYNDFFQQAVDLIDTTCDDFVPPG
jgi:hypothetical protein